jgi:TolB-like protein/Tfp pilus assembly protein PilF
LRRRNVFRVAAAYVVVGWVIVQVVSAVHAPLSLPDWFETVVVVLLAIGLPLALVLAWAFELTPEGIRLTGPDGTAAPVATNRLDYVLIGALLLVGAVSLWGRVGTPDPGAPATTDPLSTEQSIAVLPFVDMSPAGDQRYFGDGIAEELLNELVRLEGLRVAGRTSSFAYRESTRDLKTIGQELGVRTVLEGSVRKDGDRIRVTAQLIDTENGYHLWSETYQRQNTDIFGIQEEIANAVAGALGVRLGVGGVNSFQGAGTQNAEAYDAYLKGVSGGNRTDVVIPHFERAIQLDPDYAAPWARLAVLTATQQWRASPAMAPEILERAYGYALRAVELDPDSAESLTLLGTVLYARKEWTEGEAAHVRALSLRAGRQNLEQYGNLLLRAGRLNDADSQFRAAEDADVQGGGPTLFRWKVLLAQGKFAESREVIARGGGADPLQPGILLILALNEGDAGAVRGLLASMPPSAANTVLYAPIAATFDSRPAVLDILRAAHADSAADWPSRLHDIALLAAFFEDDELALLALGDEVRYTVVRLDAAWYPLMSGVRRLPGFKQLVTDLNLVGYWRTHRWADACRPVGPEEFACE